MFDFIRSVSSLRKKQKKNTLHTYWSSAINNGGHSGQCSGVPSQALMGSLKDQKTLWNVQHKMLVALQNSLLISYWRQDL